MSTPSNEGTRPHRAEAGRDRADPRRDRADPRRDDRVRDLERRIRLLESADEEAFGAFTAIDWWICGLAFVVLPLLLVWWAA